MPTPNPNDVHIKSVLMMLPFDEAKASSSNLGLNLKKVSADTYSFLDANHQPVLFKLIASLDSDQDSRFAGKPHDAAAFVRVDADGHPLDAQGHAPTAGRVPQVIATFPGAKNMNEMVATSQLDGGPGVSGYLNSFFNAFMDEKLAPQLKKLDMGAGQVEVVSHSSGDKFAATYAAHYGNPNVMMIESYDRADVLSDAASLEAVRQVAEGKGHYEALFKANLTRLAGQITEINQDTNPNHPQNGGNGAFQNAIDMATRILIKEDAYGNEAYHVNNTEHRVGTFLFKKPGDFVAYTKQEHITPESMAKFALTATPGDPEQGVARVERLMFFDGVNAGAAVTNPANLRAVQLEMFKQGLQMESESVKAFQQQYLPVPKTPNTRTH